MKPKIIKVKRESKKPSFQKCVVCKTKLEQDSISEPFSINSIVGQECPTIFSYLKCPKCGIMYQKSAQTLKKEKEEKENIGFGIFEDGSSTANPFATIGTVANALFQDKENSGF